MVHAAKSGHPGGSLSAADILTYLYFEKKNITKDDVKSKNRDRFVLSKGHASPSLYGILKEAGLMIDKGIKTLFKEHNVISSLFSLIAKVKAKMYYINIEFIFAVN